MQGIIRGACMVVIAIGASGLHAASVRAGGFEFPAPGTRPLGRGGAFYARADSPLALLYNPANLARLPRAQLQLGSHLTLFDACFHRGEFGPDGFMPGTYTGDRGQPTETSRDTRSRFAPSNEPPPDGYEGVEYPKVCNGNKIGPVPQLALSLRPIEQLGIGIGVIAPAGVGFKQYGNDDGTVSVDADVPTGRLPSPARYDIVDERLFIAFPTLGVGYAPHPRFRLGATFSPGVAVASYSNYVVLVPEERFDTDVKTDLDVRDVFVPRVSVSVHAVPHDRLDIMAGFTWVDDVNAEGSLELITGNYRADPTQKRVSECSDVPYSEDERCVEPVNNVELHAPQPWKLQFGIRYAHRLRPRSGAGETIREEAGEIDGPMRNERWDVELDIVYERNSRVDALVADVPLTESGEPQEIVAVRPGTDDRAPLPLPEEVIFEHRWKDQVSLRLGGDYNVIPGRLALRAGLSFETDGVRTKHVRLDFLPHQRYGLHGGLTVRVARLDISVAYAHIFQEDQNIREPAVEQVVGLGAQPIRVNGGKVRSSFDVLSGSLRYHF